MGMGHLDRLRRAAALLTRRGVDTAAVRLACYSGAGFSDELWAAGDRGDVVLVDLGRLYGGGVKPKRLPERGPFLTYYPPTVAP